jgi:hypothetical protein
MNKFLANIASQIENPGIEKKNFSKFIFIWISCLAIVIALKIFREFGLEENTDLYYFLKIDIPNYFPFSIFKLQLNWRMILVLPILILIIRYVINKELTSKISILIGAILALLMNFGNGGLEDGFVNTLTYGDVTYYYEALKIDNWVVWLANFNELHSEMLNHSASHPPGPTLLIYFLSNINSVLPAVLIYSFLSLLNLPLLYLILKKAKVQENRIPYLILLYSVIPSFNLYSILCVDSAFLLFFNLFLLGLLHEKKAISICLICSSLILVAFFSFAVTFLLALLFLYSIKDGFNFRRFIMQFGMPAISLMLFYSILDNLTGFNLLEAFFTASQSENPNGFMFQHNPLNYIFTRIEGLFEWSIMIGIPVLLIILKKINVKPIQDNFLQKSIILVIVLMLLSGAFRTGETGRVLMFTYPYFLLLLKDLNISNLKFLIVFTFFQSLMMQSFGFWVW